MLRSLLSSLLGTLVEGAPAVEEGKVTLTDAVIRPDVMNFLGLPSGSRRGRIGFLSLEVQQDSLWGGANLHVEMRDLALVVGEASEESEESRGAKLHQQKAANFARDTKARLEALLQSSGDVSLLSVWKRSLFFGRVLSKISVTIHGVHLAYQDSSTSDPFAIGIFIAKMSLLDADDECREPGSKQRAFEVEGLRLYRATGTLGSEEAVPPSGAKDILPNTNASVLMSFSGQGAGRVHLQTAACEVPELKFVLEPSTLRDLSSTVAVLQCRSLRAVYVTRRPTCPYKGNSAEWWRYALLCVKEIVHRERVMRSPAAVSVRIQDLLQYARLYSAHLQAALRSAAGVDAAAEPDEDRSTREALESGLPWQTVIAIRDKMQQRLHETAASESASKDAGADAGNGSWWRVRWLQGSDTLAAGVGRQLLDAADALFSSDGGGGGAEEPGGESSVSLSLQNVSVELWDAKRRGGAPSGAESKAVSLSAQGVRAECSGGGAAMQCSMRVQTAGLEHLASPSPVEPHILCESSTIANADSVLRLDLALRQDGNKVDVKFSAQLQRMEIVNSPPFHHVLLPFRAHVVAPPSQCDPLFAAPYSKESDWSWRRLAGFVRRGRDGREWKVEVDVDAQLPDLVVPATCEFRDRNSSLLVCRPGRVTLQTKADEAASAGLAGLEFGLDGACIIACKRSDDWRAELERGGRTGQLSPFVLLRPLSISSTISPAEPGQALWSTARAPVAVREIVIDGSQEKLSRALECVVYAFSQRAVDQDAAHASFANDGPLSLSGALAGLSPLPLIRVVSTLMASSSRPARYGSDGGRANRTPGWSVSVEFEKFLLLLKEKEEDRHAELVNVEVGRVWAGVSWGGEGVGAKLRVRHITVSDCRGRLQGSEVQLVHCSSMRASEDARDEQEDFLVVSVDVEPEDEDEDEESARRVSAKVDAGAVHAGLSLAAAARLQNFITAVATAALPGGKASAATKLRTSAPTRSGVLYSARHQTQLARQSRALLWSMSSSLSSLSVSILVPRACFAVGSTDWRMRDMGSMEELGEVSRLTISDLQFQRQRSRRFADEWTCELGSLRMVGSREHCGDHGTLLEMPTAAESASLPAIHARRVVQDKGWRPKARADADPDPNIASKPASGLTVRAAAFEGVILMRLVTFVATSVMQSDMYISNSQRVVAAAVDLAAKAKSKATAMLYNQEHEELLVEIAGGSLHMPCERRAAADRVLVGIEPLVISSSCAVSSAGSESSSDLIAASVRVTMSMVLDGTSEEVLGLAATAQVERQLKLDRLDPAVPRVKARVEVGDVDLRVGQAQLGLLYRIVRWNSGQAEEARRAGLLAARSGLGSHGAEGKGKPADGAAVGRASLAPARGVGFGRSQNEGGGFQVLDRRKVGIRVVDWVVEVETQGLTVRLKESVPEFQEPKGPEAQASKVGVCDIVEFRVGAVKVRMERWSDTVSKGELSIECVRLTDVDPMSQNVLRNIIGPKGDGKFLKATLDSDGDGETHRVNVECCSQEANFAPGPLLRVATFLLSSSLVDASQITELSHPEVAPVGESATSLAMPRWRRRMLSLMMRPLEQDGLLDLHFQVAPCQIVVWEDSTHGDSAHTFVRFDIAATYLASLREHTTKICLGGVDAAVRTSERGGESSILSGLTLTYDAIRKHDTMLEVKERVSLSKLQLAVGYHDIKGVLTIGSQWSEQARSSGLLEAHGALQILQAAKRAAAAAADRMVEGIQQRAGAAGEQGRASAAPDAPGDKGGVAESPASGGRKEMSAVESGKDAVQRSEVAQRRTHMLVSDQVRLCIINDCVGFNVPLCEAILAPFSISTTSGSGGKGLHSKGQLRAEANFYNILSGAFEPVLEPFKMDVTSDLYVDATGAHNFSVVSKQRMEINVSETHVCSLLSTIEAWSQDLLPHIKLEDAADVLRARGSKIWPYNLRNETGCPLRFWAGRSPTPPDGGEVHSLCKDGEKPFAFAKAAAAGGGGPSMMELHCVSVEVEGAVSVVTGVPVDTIGVHMFPLDDGQVLIVEVTIGAGGGKLIAVQSVVKICNHTDLDMEIAVVTRQGNPVWLESLAPAKHFCLPTHLRECYAVLVRPVEDSSSFEWSERILLPFRSQPSSVDWSLVTCSTTPDPQGLDPSRKCFQVRVDAKKPHNPDESSSSCIRAVLSVHPILRISNALPVRANFSVLSADVMDRSEQVLFEKDVDAAKQLYLYSVDKKTALGLIVNIPGLDRVRQPALIYHPEGQELSDRIELVDEWGSNLFLGLEHETTAWGDVTIVIYALYEIHNHSGLSLFYAQEGWDVVGLPTPRLAAGQDPSAIAVQSKSVVESVFGQGADAQRADSQGMVSGLEGGGEPKPFVFCTEGEGVSAGRLCATVGGGEWSKPLSLDSLGSAGGGVLELSLPGGNAYGPKPAMELAVQLDAGARRLERGKVVTLHPRFTVINTTEHVLQVAQAGLEKYYALGLAGKSRRTFHWGDSSGRRCLRMRVCKEGGEEEVVLGGWSGGISLDAEGSFAMRVPTLEGGYLNLKADVRVVGAATRLFIAAESERYPSYLVRNDLRDRAVRVLQVGCAADTAFEVEPGKSAVLCWEEPLESHKVSVQIREGQADAGSVQVQMDDLGVSGWKVADVQVTVSARGPTRVLRITQDEREDEAQDSEEAATAGHIPRGSSLVRTTVSLNLGGVGLSLLDGGLEELLFLSLSQVKGQYTVGLDDVSWELKVGKVQVDNQTDVGAPVVVHRVVRNDLAAPPMLHVSVVRQIDTSLKWYRYIAVSLQELRLAIHETILVRIAGVVQSIVNASSLISAPDLKDAKLLRWLKGKSSADAGFDLPPPKARRLYVEALHLHPLLLHVAFTPTGEIADRYNQRQQMQGGSGGTASNLVSFVRGLNMSFPSVEGTPLSLNALIMNRFFGSGSELRSCLWQHYKQHLKRQLYASWAPGGSSLANPSASINRMATDARDLFYHPAQSLVRSPADLKEALRSGGVHVTRSLHGSAVTFGQISRSVSKALAQLAAEEEAAGPRAEANARSQAPNAQEAFSEGALEFRRTLDEAAAGILKKPLQALESEGVGGFLAGLGKGLLGGVMKPTAGMLDLAAKTSDGFVNAANDTSSEFAGRVRPPRTTSLDGVLRVYDARAATGADVLRRVNGGSYRHDLFVAYAQLQGMEALLVTDKRLVVMEVCTLEVRFKVKMSDIGSARTQGSGVLVSMKSPSSQGLKFYTEALGVSSPKPDRHLLCGDLDTAEFLVSSITACCQAAAAEDAR